MNPFNHNKDPYLWAAGLYPTKLKAEELFDLDKILACNARYHRFKIINDITTTLKNSLEKQFHKEAYKQYIIYMEEQQNLFGELSGLIKENLKE